MELNWLKALEKLQRAYRTKLPLCDLPWPFFQVCPRRCLQFHHFPSDSTASEGFHLHPLSRLRNDLVLVFRRKWLLATNKGKRNISGIFAKDFELFIVYIFNTVFFGCTAVINLHKLNSMLITVIINLLQFFDDLKWVVVVLSILKYQWRVKIFPKYFLTKHKKNLQKTTTKLSMFWINVPSVFADTSSITSSSSPVDLFSMSHSRTSSSRDNSSVKRTWKRKFYRWKIMFSELGLSPDQSKINERDKMRNEAKNIFFLANICLYILS